MRANRVSVIRPGFTLIDIDNGSKHPLPSGEERALEHADGVHPLAYYVLAGTRLGAIQRFWEEKQRDGTIRLTYIAEEGDPTLDGIPLPITNRNQLTEYQMTHLVCGHLVKGKFLCNRCTLEANLVYPDAIALYPINIIPYSQVCSKCGLVVFNIWQARKGGPLSLFV